MALPKRIPKEKNRSERWRSPAHCNFVRQHECSVPGCTNRPIEVAHVRNGSDAGMGRKPSDFYTISLCGGLEGHHGEQHRIGEDSFAALHKIDLHALAREFCEESPKASEIKRVRQERLAA